MIYQLMKRDLSWRIAVFAGVLALAPSLATGPGSPVKILMVAMPALFLTALARPQQHATLFQAGLPVLARDLFLARLLSLLATVWLPITVYASAGSDWSVRTLEWGMLLAFLVLLPLATRAGEMEGPGWVAPVEWFTGLAIGGTGLYFLPPSVFLASSTIMFAALFIRTWVTLPPSFQCAPREAVADRPIGVSRKAPAASWWTFARLAIPWWTLLYVPLIAAQFMLGNMLLAWCFCGPFYSQIRTRMRWMQALPVSRRTFLWFALIPSVLPMIAGAVFVSGRAGEVSLHYRGGTVDVRFPLELWRYAPAGVAPMVEAPWGETYQLVPETFLGYPLYNPYSVGPHSSTRFLEWQRKRAEDAVKAQPLTGPRTRILYVAAISALSLGALWVVELLWWFRLARLSPTTRSGVGLAILAPLFAIPLSLDMTHMSQGFGSVSAGLLHGLAWRMAGRLPDNPALMAAVAAIPTLFLLWLLDRQIRESEGADSALVKPRT